MKKNAVWLFAGGPMQLPAAQKIVEHGYELIITDMNEDCICANLASELISLDTFDVMGNLNKIPLLQEKYNIKAVFTCAADCHYTVAVIARELSCHGIDPAISHICRNKHISRDVLRNASIYQPESLATNNFEVALNFAEKHLHNIVVKATDNSASRGFTKVGKGNKFTKEIFDLAIENGTTGLALIEEIIEPSTTEISELSVETLWFNGDMIWLNWVDRVFKADLFKIGVAKIYDFEDIGWGVEVGHINPADHSDSIKSQIQSSIFKAGVAIGMDSQKGGHILKADIMIDKDDQPVILELTPRLSGGWDSSATTPARGGDFIGGSLQLALGADDLTPKIKEYFSMRDSQKISSVMAGIPKNANNCIGRVFALGIGSTKSESVNNAISRLNTNNFL
jgi:biotin carboxylase